MYEKVEGRTEGRGDKKRKKKGECFIGKKDVQEEYTEKTDEKRENEKDEEIRREEKEEKIKWRKKGERKEDT